MSEVFPDAPTDGVAIAMGEQACTWAELDRRTFQVAHGLRGTETLGVLAGNCVPFTELMLGAIFGGATAVPVNWHLAVDEVAYILENSGASLLVVDRDHEGVGREAAARAGVDRVLVLGSGYEDWRDAQPVTDPGGSGKVMLYSSGTTGRPKGVVRPAPPRATDTIAGLRAVAAAYGFADGGRHLVTGPLYHGAPLGFAAYALTHGQTLVLMPRWDAEEALRLIEEHRVTSVHFVPTMFVRLLRLPEEVRRRYDLSSLQQVFHGAAPCPLWAKRAMIDWLGPIVTEYYGSSEGGGPTIATAKEWLDRPGTVGRPIPGIGVHVLDDEGGPVPTGEPGTLWFTSAQGPPAYLGDLEKTAATQRSGGMFTVGDVGRLDEDGYVYLTDRKIDMIISGGVNIYPAEVEACLSEHPAVADCTVFGVPDPEWGEQVKAAVELVGGASATEEELIGWCRDRIAAFKTPKSVDVHDRLPRDEAGKLRKRLLRATYWEDTGRSI